MMKQLYWTGILLISFVVAIACSGADGGGEDTDSNSDDGTEFDIDKLPWPEEDGELLPCTPYPDGFAEPTLSAPTGDIYIDLSAKLQPTDVDEKILIEVRDESGRDSDADGTVTLYPGSNATLVSITALTAGRAEAIVRFNQPGLAVISATVSGTNADSRVGRAEVMVYVPQLPIWELTIDEDDYDEMKEDSWERIKVPAQKDEYATLTVDDTDYTTKVRYHGGSSRGYKKKSFRFDLGPLDVALPDSHDHIILRAEWNDKTMLRNYLCLETFRNGTWIHTPRAEIVHFRINGRYHGVMWRVERIGGDFLRTRGLDNESGAMYEADPGRSCWIPGGDLTPVDSVDTYKCIYDQKKGKVEYDDLIDLIETTLQLPDAEFEKTIEQFVDVNAYLLYMAVNAVIQNHDHVRKNYYLYRDPDGQDNRWLVIPWDMEITLGHLWSEEFDVLDEDIITDANLDFGVCPGFCNHLMTRLYNTAKYEDRFYDYIDYVAHNTFTDDFIDDLIDNVICRATPDLLADQLKRATTAEYMSRVDEIRDYVAGRRDFILAK